MERDTRNGAKFFVFQVGDHLLPESQKRFESRDCQDYPYFADGSIPPNDGTSVVSAFDTVEEAAVFIQRQVIEKGKGLNEFLVVNGIACAISKSHLKLESMAQKI